MKPTVLPRWLRRGGLTRRKRWKVYGPDLNGHFGSLQGTGGLEATILDSGGTTQGVINDQFGNGVASVTGSTATWFATRVGAYGPLPGTQAATLTDITQLAAATAWRGRRIDPAGFYDLGARYYEPTSGRFLSADPMGHASSPSLYDFAGGDPVNFFDPTGRCPTSSNKFSNGLYKPTEVNLANGFNDPGAGGLNPVDPNPVVQNGVARAASDGGTRFLNQLFNDLVNLPQSIVDSAGSAAAGIVNLLDPGTRAQAASDILGDIQALGHQQTYTNTAAYLLTPEGLANSVFAIDMGIAGSVVGSELGGTSISSEASGSGVLPPEIVSTFPNGEYAVKTLTEDMTAYRYSGGVSDPVGHFLTDAETVAQISSPTSASIALNLPAGATAETLNTFTIPAGTTIYTGGVAGGADSATQIFIMNKSVLIPK